MEFAAAPGPLHRVRAPLPVPRGRGLLPAPTCWARLEAGRAAGLAAGVHRRAHPLPVPAGGRVRGRHGRGVRGQDRARAAGPADRGGQGPVRPRGRPRPNASRPLRPGTSTSPWPTWASRVGSRSTATWTWPTPWTSRPRSPQTPTNNWSWVRPTPSTYAAPRRSATWPATNPPSTSQPRTPRSRPGAASARWCCTSTSNTPPSSAPAALARLQETRGPVTAEQVREWCANPDTQITVQPVLDLAEHLHVGSYEASARLKLQTQLRDRICAFAFCFRPAEACDCEHRVPAEDGGPTCSCNQAPCCRGHHRAKTTGGWNYITIEPGVYLWRSPLGYQFLKDHTGTLDVTPDDQRRELARTFIAHFGEP